MKKNKLLTKSEERVMDFLWEKEDPVTISDIEQYFKKKNLTKATAFKAVQSLLNKNCICVNGVERATKTYARRFSPVITKEEYAAVLLEERGIDINSVGNLVVAMIGNQKKTHNANADEIVIKELKSVIQMLRDRSK